VGEIEDKEISSLTVSTFGDILAGCKRRFTATK
jgi:hypothetical protein